MKKYIRLALIFGWFFAFQTPYQEGVNSVTIVGPFTSEMECKNALAESIDFARELGVPAKHTKCQYKQET